MDKLKLGICQMAVVESKEKNRKKARKMVAEAAEQGCQLVVLPEMFNCPYQTDYFAAYAEPYPDGETIQMLSEVASHYKIILVGGSIPERDTDGRIYNTCFIFDETGKLAGRHRKVHLFDVDMAQGTFFQESSALTAGETIGVVTAGKWCFGVGICYDIRFPEMARLMTLKGAKLLIYPGAFGPNTGPAHWELLLRSRAIDNQVFILGVSPAPTPGAAYQAYGHSMAVDPWGNILSAAGSMEAVLCPELNFATMRQVRAELPLLKHRRPDIYHNSL
ncbi:Omega-amidase NIT2-A [Propionispora sp. 2/2-37]|uniref:carbon-nitrogen hydrolase family protein n=1 Tax=Propionispora sp. 2/2-37 TaxID=1677858 RepID=UPI0006BB9556|nr:carbon-nitrogen hydrolase family protein [Propionispora sp. 2/2-37]CUH95790.1 Omega-amidase NIT2-A [Propionispora sp. 2/2-37]